MRTTASNTFPHRISARPGHSRGLGLPLQALRTAHVARAAASLADRDTAAALDGCRRETAHRCSIQLPKASTLPAQSSHESAAPSRRTRAGLRQPPQPLRQFGSDADPKLFLPRRTSARRPVPAPAEAAKAPTAVDDGVSEPTAAALEPAASTAQPRTPDSPGFTVDVKAAAAVAATKR